MTLEAKKLGQLLLMQSVLINLPDRRSMFSFVCRGLIDVPGVAEVGSFDSQIPPENQKAGCVYLPVGIESANYGVIILRLSDPERYSDYSEYVKNFVFTLGVVLEERNQRQLNKEHSELLELRVEERTLQLKNEVAERRSIEDVLRESEERYRLTMLAANDGMFDFDVPSQQVHYSDRWFTMLGYEPGELSQNYDTWKALLHPDDSEEVEKKIWDNINTKRRWQAEFRMVAKDGSWRWILARGLCVKISDDGSPVRVIGTHTDITERIEAQNKLRQYQEQLEGLVRERTKDLQEKNTELEHAMARLQETQSQLILFEKMGALRHLVAGIAHEINNPLGAIESSRDVIIRTIDNIVHSMPQIASWLAEPDGSMWLEMINKGYQKRAAALKLSTAEIRQIRKGYEDLFRENGIADPEEFASQMIEMRIFDDIGCYLPLLRGAGSREKLDIITEFIDASVASETIAVAVGRTAKIINALNSYIRRDIDHESGESIRVEIDIRQSLENVLILFQSTIRSDIELELHYDDDLPSVCGISDELNQVWTNILQNAIQAMTGHGKITIRVEKFSDGLIVHITDNGCGMTPEVQAKIFEPLFTTRPAGEGIGLGMDIVHKIVVDKHAGRIDIASEPGKGTTVSVFLPRDYTSPA